MGGQTEALLHALRRSAIANVYLTAYDKARERCNQMRELAHREGRPLDEAEALKVTGKVDEHQRRFPHAVEMYEKAMICLEGQDAPVARAKILINWGVADFECGRYGDAESRWKEVVALTSDEDRQERAEALNNLAVVATMQGDLDQAWNLYEEVLQLDKQQNGDEDKVPSVLGDAFDSPKEGTFDHFHGFLSHHGGLIPENILVIETDSGEAVGTTTARLESAQVGRLHRVGVRTQHQGRGLGKILVLQALHHIVKIGASVATVATEDYNLAAISVYLKVGFQPVSDRAYLFEKLKWVPPYDMEETWEQIYAKLASYQERA